VASLETAHTGSFVTPPPGCPGVNKRGHVLNAALLAVGLGYVLNPDGGVETVRTVAAVSVPVVLGALFPDVDTAFGKHRKTLHNLPVLVVVGAYPVYFANLQWVWLGVLTHYVLDVLGTTRGIALLYPLWDREFNVPVGVPVDSRWSGALTIAITVVELVVIAGVVYYAPPTLQQASEGLGLGAQAIV
jgi:membrane-bound metal-dependent hydrolase YbcI (DUF457 family)